MCKDPPPLKSSPPLDPATMCDSTNCAQVVQCHLFSSLWEDEGILMCNHEFCRLLLPWRASSQINAWLLLSGKTGEIGPFKVVLKAEGLPSCIPIIKGKNLQYEAPPNTYPSLITFQWCALELWLSASRLSETQQLKPLAAVVNHSSQPVRNEQGVGLSPILSVLQTQSRAW